MSENFRITRNNIPEIESKIKAATRRGYYAIGVRAVRNIGYLTPVDTGNLKSSFTFQAHDDHVIIGTDVRYAIFQEMGTIKMQAANRGKGYFRIALRESMPDFEGIMEQELRNI
jgi:phage gpG-like protein